jgi:hypothetical protein
LCAGNFSVREIRQQARLPVAIAQHVAGAQLAVRVKGLHGTVHALSVAVDAGLAQLARGVILPVRTFRQAMAPVAARFQAAIRAEQAGDAILPSLPILRYLFLDLAIGVIRDIAAHQFTGGIIGPVDLAGQAQLLPRHTKNGNLPRPRQLAFRQGQQQHVGGVFLLDGKNAQQVQSRTAIGAIGRRAGGNLARWARSHPPGIVSG